MEMMKQRVLLVLVAMTLLFAGCNDDEDDNNSNPPGTVAPHKVDIYSKDGVSGETDLATVSYNGSILQYCGSTDEQGGIDMIKTVSFAQNGSTTVFHYLFDDEGRV